MKKDMAHRKIRHWGILLGIVLLLVLLVRIFAMDDAGVKAIGSGFIVLLLFLALIYFQLKFYQQGDRRDTIRTRTWEETPDISVPDQLKSPLHRAIWKNMELTRRLMRQKEEEFYRTQRGKEKQLLRLCHEEDILFISDRSWLFFWPVSVCALISLAVAAWPARELPPAYSFGCLLAGLLGLLLSTVAKSHTRYYLTNFRILIKRQFPWSRPRWSTLNYPTISLLSREKRFAWEELCLKSDEETVCIRGLPPDKLETALDILHRRLQCSSQRNRAGGMS